MGLPDYAYDSAVMEQKLGRAAPPPYVPAAPPTLDPHVPGAKLDHGKVRAALVLGAFAAALWQVARVGTFGANKYSDNGWLTVPNGEARYADAQMRHQMAHAQGEHFDEESNLLHLAHEAWNSLAKLTLFIRNNPGVKF